MNAQVGTTGYVTGDVSGGISWARQIEMVVRSMQVRLGVSVDPALIRAEVEAEFATYAAARVREFVPILVESNLRDRMRP